MRERLTHVESAEGVGPQLRAWRAARGLSQLHLSLDAGLSQRQISFIETGRSVPGRANLLHLADVLDIPFRDRNPLLLAAGYAPIYDDDGPDAAEMAVVRGALDRMLRQHDPLPALILDRYWNVVSRIAAAQRFFGAFVDLDARPEPRNLLDLVFDPQALRPFLANWEVTARSLFARVAREATGHHVDSETQELLARLAAYPEVKTTWAVATERPSLPVVPLTFVRNGQQIGLFSLVTTVGTPRIIAAQELRLESMFPIDDAAERAYLKLIAD